MADLYIASCVARVQPQHLLSTRQQINALHGCKVEGDDGSSKLIVVMEGHSTGSLLDSMDRIRYTEHVLSVDMVYQHAEDDTVMNELINEGVTCL